MPSTQTRRYCFTLNNYTKNQQEVLAAVECDYMIVAEEIAPTTGTPHLQGYVVFKKNKRLTGAIKALPGCHVIPATGTTAQNIVYCSKDKCYVEYGTPPMTPAQKGLLGKAYWTDVIRAAKAGTVEEEYPSEFMRYNTTCRKLRQVNPPTLPTLNGKWYYGPSGTGKSKKAREMYPGLYDKLLNKWWDNYDNEDVVLLDDLGHFAAPKMGPALKRWADHYPFRAEVKNGSMVIRPQMIIVTSQYTIEELFPNDVELQTALNRRFETVVFTAPPDGWFKINGVLQ